MITTNKGKGIWIAIDGCECAGKTTLIEKIKKNYKDVVAIPEFSDSSLGRWLENEVTSKPFFVTKSKISSALLFLSDYFELQNRLVTPALNENKIVISDRGALSKIAVQFAMLEEECGEKALHFLEKLFELSPLPDLSIILNTPDQVICDRIIKRSGSCDYDRMEMNRRTNELLRYFGKRMGITYECLSFDEAEERLKKIILNKQ